MALAINRRRLFLAIVSITVFISLIRLLDGPSSKVQQALDQLPIPGRTKSPDSEDEYNKLKTADYEEVAELQRQWRPRDEHPISKLMAEADERWRAYNENRSTTFKGTVATYRRRYGRHPPPGFEKWYRFARERKVHNIDDFDQIMDDLRPFWAVPPLEIRSLAAHMWETEGDAVSAIHVRNGKIVKVNSHGSWRPETMASMIEGFVKHLPDMDIAINLFDQPRVMVPWEDLQRLLDTEVKSRQMLPNTSNEFTAKLEGLLSWEMDQEADDSPRENAGWFDERGQRFMDVIRAACPPKSHANNGMNVSSAEATWKHIDSGIVTNFNLSTDLCTMGPEIEDKHGLLIAPSSLTLTKRLVPIFNECKLNVNNDILFPANMYWKHDDRYEYEGSHDAKWEEKEDTLLWRGVTSGGVQYEDNWERMHRQRLVLLTNHTEMYHKNVSLYTETVQEPGHYDNYPSFQPSNFLETYTDVAFVEAWGCIPDCRIYDGAMTWKDHIPLGQQFEYKYLIDVDGHSFSGRWRPFLRSMSLGIKATIFREWHDSRLFAWRHFAPLDNRYQEIFSVLGYFIGIGKSGNQTTHQPFIPEHGLEAKKLALQGREWASKVLRREDIEVSQFIHKCFDIQGA